MTVTTTLLTLSLSLYYSRFVMLFKKLTQDRVIANGSERKKVWAKLSSISLPIFILNVFTVYKINEIAWRVKNRQQ
jgi:hypothetical protein